MGKQTGIIKIYNPTKSQILVKYFIFNKNIEGYFIGYNENEIIIDESNYINNKVEGIKKHYYANQQLAEICNYKNGKRKGEPKYIPFEIV